MSHRVEQIGDATLYLGDCLEILPTLGKVDAVVTDPPYGTGGWRRVASGNGRNPSGTLVIEPWDDGAVAWLDGLYPVPILSFWAPARMPQLMARLHLAGYSKIRLLYMRKRDPKPQIGGRVAWSVEPLVCASPEGFQLYGGTDWIEASTPRMGRDTDAVDHPYQKPLDVLTWAIEKTEVETILDPFMGSGTTGVACAKLGRKFIGIEIEPKYFDIACDRIRKAYDQPDMFIERPKPPKQEAML